MTQIKNFTTEGTFPLILRPRNQNITYEAFINDLQDSKDKLHELLLSHGALFFRGFPVKGAANFASVIEAVGLGEFVNYIGGNSPRTKVEQKVYTSTEAPPHVQIGLHQELSYIKNFPRNIYFYCETASPTGGATIIGDARRISQDINPDVKKRFQEKGLTYTSRYYHDSKLMEFVNKFERANKSWIEVFETEDKEEVEKRCTENGFSFRWLPRDWIEITQTLSAFVRHPNTQEEVWFNQAHHYDFNPRLIGLKYYFLAKALFLDKSLFVHSIKFGDGSPVSREDLYHIMDVLDQHTVNYPWQSGDVMMLDNVLAMHGRAPFTGKRRVLTALTS